MPKRRAVVVDGIEYKSISLAERGLKMNLNTLRKKLEKGKKDIDGHVVAYLDEIKPQMEAIGFTPRKAERVAGSRLLGLGYSKHSLGHNEDRRA